MSLTDPDRRSVAARARRAVARAHATTREAGLGLRRGSRALVATFLRWARRGDGRVSVWRLVGAAAAVAVGVGMLTALTMTRFGLWDDAMALVGETVFGVDELPAIAEPRQRSVVLDHGGNEIGVLTGPENRRVVPLEEMPQVLRDAVVAVEDADFRGHGGIAPAAIARAALRNLLSLDVEQGGSTITQQYVKNALLTSEQSLRRKVTEATWAVRLEQRLDKDAILERYLNIAYFGNGAYGVAAASERYFSRPVQELDLPRAALLAGLVQRPAATDPLGEPAAAAARRDVVLARMRAVGAISAEEAERARVDVGGLLDPGTPPRPPQDFFMEHVKHELLAAEELGDSRDERAGRLFGGGLTIRTTLDVRMQQAAEDAIAAHVDDPLAHPLAGLVAIEPVSGAVRVMAVGPKRFGDCGGDPGPCPATKVNPLAPGLGGSGRQVGSAFKPFVLAAALRSGVDTDWHTDVSSGQAVPGCGSYTPHNYDYSGGVDDVVEAIVESNNVFHVKLAEAVGQEEVATTAADLGIDTELAPECALALGAADAFPIDVAEGYAAIANDGIRCEPHAVVEVLDADGAPLLTREPTCERVLQPHVAETLTTLLRGVAERGTATGAQIDRPIAAKTGTTDDNRDAWLIGFTTKLAAASWVGFEQPAPMEDILGHGSISGGTVPADIWADFMAAALAPLEPGELPRLSLQRYRRPECPPPPSEDERKELAERRKDEEKRREDEAEEREKEQEEQGEEDAEVAPEPVEPAELLEVLPRFEGFDPVEMMLQTRIDGDSFTDGHQPEDCVQVAPPEAYLGDSEDGGSNGGDSNGAGSNGGGGG